MSAQREESFRRKQQLSRHCADRQTTGHKKRWSKSRTLYRISSTSIYSKLIWEFSILKPLDISHSLKDHLKDRVIDLFTFWRHKFQCTDSISSLLSVRFINSMPLILIPNNSLTQAVYHLTFWTPTSARFRKERYICFPPCVSTPDGADDKTRRRSRSETEAGVTSPKWWVRTVDVKM